MVFDRRNFILSSLALSGLYACAPDRVQYANEFQTRDDGKRLIIIELSGGNDGLNTIVPFEDDNYQRIRPTLALKKRDIIKLNDEVGINGNLSKVTDLYFNGEVAVIQGVGYPNPSHSHFKSTALWHVGGDGIKNSQEGWVASAAQSFMPDAAAHGISFSDEMGQFFHKKGIFISARNIDQLRQIKINGFDTDKFRSEAVSVVAKRAMSLKSSLRSLQKHLRNYDREPDLVKGALGKQLSEVIKVIQSGAPVPVFSVKLSGFDTHVSQFYRHRKLMRELNSAIMDTRNELIDSGHWENTLILTTSEFGRRPMENKSRGTDHGTAAPHFIVGGKIRGGLFGTPPKLSGLGRNKDLEFTMDYRAIYNSIIEDYFGVQSSFKDYRDKKLSVLFAKTTNNSSKYLRSSL